MKEQVVNKIASKFGKNWSCFFLVYCLIRLIRRSCLIRIFTLPYFQNIWKGDSFFKFIYLHSILLNNTCEKFSQTCKSKDSKKILLQNSKEKKSDHFKIEIKRQKKQ
jgi:hypothetical protein